MTELLTVQEVAKLTGFSTAAIVRACKRGEMGSKLCGRWRISRDDYERWILAGRVTPPAREEPAPSGEVGRRERAHAAGSFRELARGGPQ